MDNSDVFQNEIEVDLAGPSSRIAAVLLNYLFLGLAYSPLIFSVLTGKGGYAQRVAKLAEGVVPEDVNTSWVLGGFAVLLLYGLVQLFFMSRDGQSLGKKIMGIRVLKTDGRNPGFFGNVLLREVVYYFLLGIVAAAAGYLAQVLTGSKEVFESVSNIVQCIAAVVCIIMMYKVGIDRRTLQDFLANTVVVKLPKS